MGRIFYLVRKFNLDVLIFYCFLVFVFFIPVKDHIIGSADSYNQFLPLRLFYSNCLKNGEFPLWYPYQALGLPFLGIVQAGGLYPFNLLLYRFFDPYWAYNFSIFIHFVMAQFFGFLFASFIYRKIGLERFFAVLSGFLFGLSSFILSHVDFVPLQNSIPYLPLSLLFFSIICENYDRNKSWLVNIKENFVFFLGLSLSLGYQFLAGYPQAFLYSFIFLIIYGIFLNYRLLWVLFFSLILSFPLIFLFAYEVLELSKISVRNYINFETYNQGSFPIFALINQVIPFIFGGSISNPTYYGPSTGTISFEFLAYSSSVSLFLTIFAFVKVFQQKDIEGLLKVLAFSGIVVFILSLGKYNLIFHYLLFDFPFYSKVRVVARHLMEISLVQSIFIPFSLHFILKEKQEFFNFVKVSIITIFVLFFLSFWFFVNPEVGRNLSKININTPDLYFPLLFGILFFVVIALFWWLNRDFRFEVLSILFVIFFFESFWFFYNISPSYVSSWWGKRENIINYLNFIEKFDDNYRIAYFTGFPLIFPGVVGKRMLNYYEPVIPFDFVKLFNIWMNGSFIQPNDYFFILNNNLLSAFSVKYIFINEEFKEKYEKFVNVGALRKGNVEIDKHRFDDLSEIFNNSKNIKVELVNNVLSLKHDSRIVLNFKNRNLNKALLICFKAKVNKVSFLYKYKRLFFNISDGLGIEVKDINNKSLSYYFLNDYYIDSSRWVQIVVPFVIDFQDQADFVNLQINIYPVNSFSRIYEIKDIEVYSFPLVVPSNSLDKKAYIYDSSFMGSEVYENPYALPIVFSPSSVKFVDSIEDVKYSFLTLQNDPLTVFIEKASYFGKDIKKAKVKIEKKGSNYIDIFYETDGFSLIVFNDLYYRGWKAIKDNHELPIIKVNEIVKGVFVEKGKGRIRFIYQPFPLFLLYLNFFFIYFYLFVFFVILFWRRHNVEHNSFPIDY